MRQDAFILAADLLDSYNSLGFGYKADINDAWSYAFIVDEPWGVSTAYPVVAGSIYSNTTADLDSYAISAILAYDIDPNWKVYGGPRFQSVEASAGLPFIGAALGGYDVIADQDWSTGWLVGGAYQRPEIALRVAVTYYSEIKHELDTVETVGAVLTLNDSVEIVTPEAVNLEFQTGIAPDTLLFGSIRWVNWSEFEISPTLFSSPTLVNQPLVDYQEDWTTYTLGVGRRFTDQWSGAVQISHEPATGALPLTTLGPVDGRTSYGLAASYTVDNVEITAGVSYITLGETANFASTQFADGDAVGVGLRIGYSF